MLSFMLFVLLDYFTIFSLSVVCFWFWLGIFRVISVQKKSLTHEPSRLLCHFFKVDRLMTDDNYYFYHYLRMFVSFILIFYQLLYHFLVKRFIQFFFKKNSEMQVFLNECIHRHFVLNEKNVLFACEYFFSSSHWLLLWLCKRIQT